MAIDWFRSYHGAPTDPKYLIVARQAKSEPGKVAAVWWALLDYASQATDRGSVDGFEPDTVAAFYGWPEEEVRRIHETFADRGMITGGRLAAWGRRQPKREDTTATERKRAERSRKSRTGTKKAAVRDVTNRHAMSRNVTQGHEASRNVTPEKSREEKRRGEGNRKPEVTSAESAVPESVSSQLAAAIDKFCERTGATWSLKDRPTRTFAAALPGEFPDLPDAQLKIEVNRAADWYVGESRAVRAPHQAIRNWLAKAKPMPHGPHLDDDEAWVRKTREELL